MPNYAEGRNGHPSPDIYRVTIMFQSIVLNKSLLDEGFQLCGFFFFNLIFLSSCFLQSWSAVSQQPVAKYFFLKERIIHFRTKGRNRRRTAKPRSSLLIKYLLSITLINLASRSHASWPFIIRKIQRQSVYTCLFLPCTLPNGFYVKALAEP